jgi:hypothetical protein
MERFELRGRYRVQSRRVFAPSTLTGTWYDVPGVLDNDVINRALSAHPLWQGRARVALRPALVRHRSGMFASEPDILYKRDLFVAAPDSAAMETDIVDVLKSQYNWAQRAGCAETLFPTQFGLLVERLRALGPIIANEYVLHEAGHFIGYDVPSKQRDGYFALGGKTAWPLIYLEELRADLNAFGFAARLLPAEAAAAIFLYNLMLRFGVHREGLVHRQQAPYGLVPFLLFCLLHELECLTVRRCGDRAVLLLSRLDATALVAVMRACADHADAALNRPETEAASPLDGAIASARYVRDRLERDVLARSFSSVMNQPATRIELP